jgi:hypothetical protein
MIEIGKTRLVTVKVKNKRTGKLEPVLGPDGKPEQKLKEANVWRTTRESLGGNFGPDRNRRLVVGLVATDQIVFRPQGTRQEVRLNVVDAYRIAIQRMANIATLERARERKITKQRQRESSAIARADRRLRLEARRHKA